MLQYVATFFLFIYVGGGAGSAPATARATSAGGCGAAVRGEYPPLLQSGAAGCEAVAVQRAPTGAGRIRTQPTATAAGAFELTILRFKGF